MDHPIANNRRNLIIYSIFWLVTAAIHGTIFYSFFDATPYLAIADGFIVSLFYGFIGLGLWYAVRFSQMETHNIGNLIVNHLTAVSITLALLLLFNYYSIQSIPVINDGYNEFLEVRWSGGFSPDLSSIFSLYWFIILLCITLTMLKESIRNPS
jgi:hypothetical protein